MWGSGHFPQGHPAGGQSHLEGTEHRCRKRGPSPLCLRSAPVVGRPCSGLYRRSRPAPPIWPGAISCGLVTIPIKVVNATESHDISFRQIRLEDGGRIRYRKICELDGSSCGTTRSSRACRTRSAPPRSSRRRLWSWPLGGRRSPAPDGRTVRGPPARVHRPLPGRPR
ncbi:Ku protein [Streptomyces sp. PKU-EA00015]|uniref:Ku protein n=1 Tax=Streptomyces sp. PKU-EA00015 TaxID=2748326 RepID=UPI0035C86BB7